MMATSPRTDARDVLGKLIEVCRDGQYGFELAAKSAPDPILRAELQQYSGQRQEFAAELIEAVRTQGEDVPDHGSVSGALHRGWINLKQAVSSNDRRAVLAECERGEQEALDVYRQAIAAGLPPQLTGIVHTQFLAISRVLGRIQSLKDNARASSE